MNDPATTTDKPSADWCVATPTLSMHGTRMVEVLREPHGEPRWCFRCRKRRQFLYVVHAPDGPSYYGPNPSIRCEAEHTDGDLGFGRERWWEE